MAAVAAAVAVSEMAGGSVIQSAPPPLLRGDFTRPELGPPLPPRLWRRRISNDRDRPTERRRTENPLAERRGHTTARREYYYTYTVI